MTDAVSKLTAALADRYRIERELGAGGMATVYLAHDVRHDRNVALKVLRPELAAILGGERFLAEIRTTANLQHPHILPLHDSGEADGLVFYVMPYVDGESLRDRLNREKQLPVDDAVRIAREVADALDYAHRQKIVHRDIKPENILLHGGHALVADFGIALAASRSDGGTRMTETGMSLGTPAYMSPEQAMGEREITPRADIYALGAVLYEMLSGEAPFTGPTAQAIIARVMTEAPRSLTLHRHTVPAHVEAAVLTALEKLPADRFAAASEFAAALADTARAAPTRPAAVRPVRASAAARMRDPAFLVLALVTLGLATWAFRSAGRPGAGPELPTIRYAIVGSDSAPIVENVPWPAAISPDGGTLVYATRERGGVVLATRRSDQLEGRVIPGTGGATQPLFSPDGQWIAFQSDGREKKVRLDGSAPVTIADGGGNNGADWSTSGVLVVGGTGGMHGLSYVNVAGGERTQLTTPDTARGETDHLWPIALPDGKTVAFVIWSGALAASELALTSLDDGRATRLDVRGIRPLAFLDGALVYLQADGAVMALPLDVRGRKARGRPVPVLDPVPVATANNGNSSIFISRGGALVTSRAARNGRLVWELRDGRQMPAGAQGRDMSSPRLSPDGRRIAVIVSDGTKSDVWIMDLASGTFSRLTTAETVTAAEWSRDGSRIVYTAAGRNQRAGVWAQSMVSAAAPELLSEGPSLSPYAAVAPDGRSLVVQSLLENRWMLQRVVLDSGAVVRTWSDSRAETMSPRFSPDGRWVAVANNESGAYEVIVRSYPVPTVKVQVSAGGGDTPVWSSDGSRVYYRTPSGAIAEARLQIADGVRVLSRDTVFAAARTSRGTFYAADYDVTRDGSRLIAHVSDAEAFQLVVSPNWITEFRQRMAANGGAQAR